MSIARKMLASASPIALAFALVFVVALGGVHQAFAANGGDAAPVSPAKTTLTTASAATEANVSSSIDTLHLDTFGTIATEGEPTQDGYSVTVTWKMRYLDYDMVFIGSAEDAAKAPAEQLIELGDEMRYSVTFTNASAAEPTYDFSQPIPLAFHVTDSTRWLDRTIAIDVENNKIAFAGAENEGDFTLLDYDSVYIGPSNFSYYRDYSDRFAYAKPWNDETRDCTVIVPDNVGGNFRVYLPPIDAVSGATVTRLAYSASGRNVKEKELPRPSNSKAYYEDMSSPAPRNSYLPNSFEFKMAFESIMQNPYTINIVRESTLSKLAAADAAGAALHIEPAFSSDTTQYSIIVPDTAESIVLTGFAGITLSTNDKKTGIEQRFTVNGTPVEDGAFTLELTGAKTTATVCAEGVDAEGNLVTVPREYKITVARKAAATATFKTTPEEALVAVYDKYGDRVYTPGNVLKAIPESYTYTVICPGYQAQSGELNLRKNIEIPVTLKAVEEKAVTPLDEVWPKTIADAANNAVTTAQTPAVADSGAVKWSQVNARYSIIAGDYVYAITQIPDGLAKIDKASGKLLKKITFDSTGSVAASPKVAPLLYADGKIFVAQDKTNIVRAFDAETLDQLWVYKGANNASGVTSISYDNGSIYVGLNSNGSDLICLTAADEDPNSADELKTASWTYHAKGGFYSIGWLIHGNYVVFGTRDANSNSAEKGTSSIVVVDKTTGQLVSEKAGYPGAISSSPVYDEATGRIFFTTYSGHFCSEVIDWNTGAFDSEQSKDIDLGTNSSYCTPIVHNARAYVGCGNGSESERTFVAVIDLEKFEVAYKVATHGGIEYNGVLSTAYEGVDGKVRVYFGDAVGNIVCLEDQRGATEAANGIAEGETTYLPVIFKDPKRYTSPIIVDTDGTLILTADRPSACELLAIQASSAQLEDITFEGGNCAYEGTNTSFDPKRMKYSLLVDPTIETLKVTPQIAGEGTVKINDETVDESCDIAVKDGDVIKVAATGADGQPTVYTFEVRFRGTGAEITDLHVAPSYDSPEQRYIELTETAEGVLEGVTSQNWCYLTVAAADSNAKVSVVVVSGDSDGDGAEKALQNSNNREYYQLKIPYGAGNAAEYRITVTSEDGTASVERTLKLTNDDGKYLNLSGAKLTERTSSNAVIEFTSGGDMAGYYLVSDSRSVSADTILASKDAKQFDIVSGTNTITVPMGMANKYVHIVGAISATGRTSSTAYVNVPVYSMDCSESFDFSDPETIDNTTTLPEGTYVPTNGTGDKIGEYAFGMRTCVVKAFRSDGEHVTADLGFGAGAGPAKFVQMAYKVKGDEEVTFVKPDCVEDGLLMFRNVPLDINGKTYFYMNSAAMNKSGQWYGSPAQDYYITVEFKVDRSDAQALLDDAQAAAEAVKVSADGTDVELADQWVNEEVKAAFDEAVAAAEAVLANEDLTQKQVDEAEDDLAEAVKAFDAAKQDGAKQAEKAEASVALDAAKAAAEGVKISADGSDVEPGEQWVTEEAKKALDDAIAAAEAVVADEKARQADVDAAKAALDEAVKAFNAAKQAGTKKTEEAADPSKTDTGKVAVKSVITVNAKKVTAKTVAKAMKKAKTQASNVKKVVLGKKVKKIAKGAFKQLKKAITLEVKTKKLTKRSIKGSLKGSKIKTVQVKVGGKKANKKVVKKYKKIFTKKVAGKKAKVK